MPEFISTFVPGFERVVQAHLPALLSGAKILQVLDGLVYYRYDGDPDRVCGNPFFNNSFLILKAFRGPGLTFDKMIKGCQGCSYRFLPGGTSEKATFRIRYSKGNRFCPVDKHMALRAERYIIDNTKLRPDRARPRHEFWYIIRREEIAFYGFLLGRRAATEKNLHKGELRPEFACLMALYAGIHAGDVVCDPFAGYGALPEQVLGSGRVKKMYVSDLDEALAQGLKARLKRCGGRADIRAADALDLAHIPQASVDAVITDPPWGLYDGGQDLQALYRGFLAECRRILKPEGTATVLTAKKEAFEQAIQLSEGLVLTDCLHVLVNGKKAALYRLRHRDAGQPSPKP